MPAGPEGDAFLSSLGESGVGTVASEHSPMPDYSHPLALVPRWVIMSCTSPPLIERAATLTLCSWHPTTDILASLSGLCVRATMLSAARSGDRPARVVGGSRASKEQRHLLGNTMGGYRRMGR